MRIGRWSLGAGTLLAATMLVGRLSGLLREMQMAAVFGVSGTADAAVLLLTLPDLLVNLLVSGGLSAALVPRLRTLSGEAAAVLLRQTFYTVLAVFAVLAVCFVVAPQVWFTLLAPGLPSQALPPLAAVIATCAAIPLTASSGVTSAALNARQRFLVAGLGTLFFNTMIIASLILVQRGSAAPLLTLGVGILAGSVLRLGTQLVDLSPAAFLGPTFNQSTDRAFARAFTSAALASSLMLLVPVIVRALASTVQPGAIAALNYAQKLIELPSGVLIASIATVMLAQLSAHYANGEESEARRALHGALRRTVANAVSVGLLVGIFADAIVNVALGRGAMGSGEIQRVANLTRVALLGLPFVAVSSIAIAELNARGRTKDVLRSTAWCLLSLPVLAYPGVHRGSEALLALAVVGFQGLHAMALGQRSGLLKSDGRAWFDRKLFASLGLGAAVVVVAVALEAVLPIATDLARLTVVGVAAAAIIVLPQRLLSSAA